MNERFLTADTFHDLLQQWEGETVRIIKHELDDVDATTMQLQTLSFEQNKNPVDDYEPLHTLSLNGTGTIETDGRPNQPLPLSAYDIPLGSDARYEFDGTQFLLRTSRGMYQIQRA